MIEEGSQITLIQIKLGSTLQNEIKSPELIAKSGKKIRCAIVTALGKQHKTSTTTERVPISELIPYLIDTKT